MNCSHWLTENLRRYAEVLESTQFALIATVQKLYGMVRSGQQWDLGEPELNDRGLPVIHDIANRLGAIRPNSDIDLPVHSVFPEDEAGMAELARQLEQQQRHSMPQGDMMMLSLPSPRKDSSDSAASEESLSSPEDVDRELDFPNHRRMAFGGENSTLTLSPASLTHSNDMEPSPTELDLSNFNMFPPHPSAMQQLQQSSWPMMHQANNMATPPIMSQQPSGMGMMAAAQQQQQRIKSHSPLSYFDPDPMVSMSDPIIFQGFDAGDHRVYDI